MNYIGLINRFWQCYSEHSFKANDVALYFFLLKTCNELGWKNPFKHSNRHITAMLDMSEKTLISSRNRLQQAGLINFKPGGVDRSLSTYELNYCNNSSSNGSSSGGSSFSSSGGSSGENAPDNIKQKETKQEQTKLKELEAANAATAEELREVKVLLSNLKDQRKEKKTPPSSAKVPLSEPVHMPWQTETFAHWWNVWKDYKKNQHRFTYKGGTSEQGALKLLNTLANGNESIAIKIIEQSISNGWSGFFELKTNGAAKGAANSSRAQKDASLAAAYELYNGTTG
jgi:hypothetical protein